MSKSGKSKIAMIALFGGIVIFVGIGIVVLSGFLSGNSNNEAVTNVSDTEVSDTGASDSGESKGDLPVVYMTSDISPEGLTAVYKALGRELPGKVAVKLHTGEPGGHHYLSPDLIKTLVTMLDGTIVECNVAYPGQRLETALHKQVAKDHGFTAIAPVDIMDEEGSLALKVPKGKNLKENFVGSHFTRYDSFLILSHFKGHQMGGFGGAIKNTSIGIASGEGKVWIHSAGVSRKISDFFSIITSTSQDLFLESMAEAASSVANGKGRNIVYINVMNNLSIDCDCSSHPAPPEMDDIGILASVDPVALDQACVDLVYAADEEKSASLRNRIEAKNGIHTLEHAEAIGLGKRKYQLVLIDK